MNFARQHTPLLLTIICAIIMLLAKSPRESWDRLIESDGRGYYAWLPAVFIYQDLSFSFYDTHEQHYYPQGEKAFRKDYRFHSPGGVVNKYFPGPALLWLPFFLLAQMLALLFDADASGYGLIHQYSMGLASLFYLWVGLHYSRKIMLHLQLSLPLIPWLLLFTALGTNLVYYSTVEPTMVHSTLYGLIAFAMYQAMQAARNLQAGSLLLFFIVSAIVFISRPTSTLILLFIPFLIFPFDLKSLSTHFRKNARSLFLPIASALIILSLPLFAWKMQTGNWLVYTYGEEKLNLSNPEFFNILFSFEKGWLLHTPMAALALLGLIQIFQRSKTMFLLFLVPFLIFTWVISSWWVWHYTSRFGHRAFIDMYFLLPVLLGYTYQMLRPKLFFTIATLLLILNLWQFQQHVRGVTPFDTMTSEKYFSNFLAYVPVAESAFATKGKSLKHFSIDQTSITKPGKEFGITLHEALPSDTPYVLVAGGKFRSSEFSPHSTLVLTLYKNGEQLLYQPFYLERYAWKNSWREMHFDLEVNNIFPDSVKMYIWTPPDAQETIWADDLFLDIRKLNIGQ